MGCHVGEVGYLKIRIFIFLIHVRHGLERNPIAYSFCC
ncbi:MAG: hypothetical protein RL754_889 [Bacteroidota bacterium]